MSVKVGTNKATGYNETFPDGVKLAVDTYNIPRFAVGKIPD